MRRRTFSPLRTPLLVGDEPGQATRSSANTWQVAALILAAALAAIVLGSVALALLVPRQSNTEASLRALTTCLADGSCVGGDLHVATLIVDGNVTAPNVPADGSCVERINGVSPTNGSIDLVGGENVVVTPDAPNHAVNISTTTNLVNITMLAVTGSTLLGNQTTCAAPILPSCLDISGQSCSAPLDASCWPANATFDVLHVNTLQLDNGTMVTATCDLGDSLTVSTLITEDLVLSGSFSCPSPSTGIPQSCLSLGGYSCPLGMPLADSCIPASLTFYDLSVTNMLSVNLVQCTQPLDASSCLVPLVGDVTGPLTATTVTALQAVPISAGTPNAQALLAYDGAQWTGTNVSWSEPSAPNTVVARDASGNITVGVLNAALVQPPPGSTSCLGLGAPGATVGACAKADLSLDYHSLTNVGSIYVDNLYGTGTLATAVPLITVHSNLTFSSGTTLWFNNATNFYSTLAGVLQTDAALVLSNTLTAYRYQAYSPLGEPTVVAGTGAGTGPTLTVTAGSTDCKLQVTVLTGTGPAASTVFTLTYRTAATSTLTSGVVFSAASATAAALTGTSAPWVSAEALGTFTFRSGTVALAATTTYVWNFQTCA